MVNLGGLTIRFYGLILGVAILVGLELVRLQAKAQNISQKAIETAVLWAIIGGVMGARLYHVITDYYLYQNNLIAILYIWQGGLSVIGAVIGGIVGVWLGIRLKIVTISLPVLLDLSVFGLPVAQAIGRVGNFINQELYGLPTTLPWGIYIDPSRRVAGYAQNDRFHPLFLYEMIANLLFAAYIWWYSRRKNTFPIGSLVYFAWYVMYYSLIRFGLDFIRVEKAVLIIPGLGFNQVVMLITFGIGVLLWNRARTYHAT